MKKNGILVWVALFFQAPNLLAAPATVIDDTATTDQDTPVIINVLENDFDPDEDPLTLVSASDPANGSVAIDSEAGTVTYTPDPGFSGTDTFTYTVESVDSLEPLPMGEVATGEGIPRADVMNSGVQASALALVVGNVTVTVIGTETPEPEVPVEQDSLAPEVSNPVNKTVATSLDNACEELGISGSDSNLSERCAALNNIATESPEQLEDILTQISPEEMLALKRVTSESTRVQMDKISQRMQQRKRGGAPVSVSLNGYNLPVTGGAAGDNPFPEVGVFASAHYTDVDRDATALEAGYDYTATGMTFGIDRRFTPELVAGIAAGWTKHDLNFQNAAGSAESDLFSVTLFTTYSLQGVNLDFQLGLEQGEYNTSRKLNYQEGGNQFVANIQGATDASQIYTSLQFDYPLSFDAMSLTPYVRADYVDMTIDAFEETGGQGYELAVDEQSLKQYTFKGGADLSYSISRDWGVLIPYVGAAVVSETSNNYGTVSFVFIEDPSQEKFELGSEGEETLFYQLRVGTSAVLTGGWSLFADYAQILGYENTDAFQISLGVRAEL